MTTAESEDAERPPIEVGDIVRVRGIPGPKMRVVSVERTVRCFWFDQTGNIQSCSFDPGHLILQPDDSRAVQKPAVTGVVEALLRGSP